MVCRPAAGPPYRGVRPVNKALGLPPPPPVSSSALVQQPAGPSRTFEEIKENYRTLLKNGAVTARPCVPHVTEAEQKQLLLKQFVLQKEKCCCRYEQLERAGTG